MSTMTELKNYEPMNNNPIKLLISVLLLVIFTCVLFVNEANSQSLYRDMYGKYRFNEAVQFVDSLFFTDIPGSGTNLVLDTITGEVRRDTVSGSGGGSQKTYNSGSNLSVSDTNDTVTYTLNNSVTVNNLNATSAIVGDLNITQTLSHSNLTSIQPGNTVPTLIRTSGNLIAISQVPHPPSYYVFKQQPGNNYNVLNTDVVSLIAQSSSNSLFTLSRDNYYKITYTVTFSLGKILPTDSNCVLDSKVFLWRNSDTQSEGSSLNTSNPHFIDDDSKSTFTLGKTTEETEDMEISITGHSSYFNLTNDAFLGILSETSGCGDFSTLDVIQVVIHVTQMSQPGDSGVQNGNEQW